MKVWMLFILIVGMSLAPSGLAGGSNGVRNDWGYRSSWGGKKTGEEKPSRTSHWICEGGSKGRTINDTQSTVVDEPRRSGSIKTEGLVIENRSLDEGNSGGS